MISYSRVLTTSSALVLLGISFATTAALPGQVFWNNEWPSDLTPTVANDELLEGTVLFAQAQVIPSNHGIENDNQPRLVALRKTLVMLQPHGILEDESSSLSEFTVTVRDKDGIIVSGEEPIAMNDPEDIPKQDGWIDLGKVEDIEFPASLENAYVVQGQESLDSAAGSETGNDYLANIFRTVNKEVEAKTWDGSWVKNIYLPKGSTVPEGSKFQITCQSSWDVTVNYPSSDNAGNYWRKRSVPTDEKLVVVLVNSVWVAEGDPKPDNVLQFPTALNDPYVVQNQQNLNEIGNDPEAVGLKGILNDDTKAPTNQVEIKTADGSWVREIYLPDGATVPADSTIQITCNSGYNVFVYYPNLKTGGWKSRRLSKGEVMIAILNPYNSAWVASGDTKHNEYVFGHNFYTATLNPEWVQPGMTIEFAAASTSSGQRRGILEADVGGVTELIITTLDAGFLTEPRNEFTFREDPTTHREYYETTFVTRLVVVQYETMHLTEIMLPTGKFYDTVSDDEGGVYSGDMREFIGKLLLSHGVDLANYGISSSLAQTEQPHKFTCALLAAHNTVGMYQNGRVVHGLSGGNGMVTLFDSVGNEMSHEIGHNYGLGHYVGGFDGSVHRPASEINSSWGWDSQKNIFLPNFSSSDTGNDQCLPEDIDNKCQSAFLGKYQYGNDSMAGGEPLWGSNRFTFYTPNSAKIIQEFMETRAIWDSSSSTGFRKYDSASGKMKEFVNDANGNKAPRLHRVPVTTIVGYYEPDPNRSLESYIYPAMNGAFGFVYNDDGGSTTGSVERCELVVKINKGSLVYNLETFIDPKGMNKFHVNVATEDEPYEAEIYCRNQLRAKRALEGPKDDEPPLTYTVNGFDPDSQPTKAPTTSPPTDAPTKAPTNSPPTDAPTKAPTNSPPTDAPTKAPVGDDNCKDRKNLKFRNKTKKNCKKWVFSRGKKKKIVKKCKKKWKKIKIWDWCPETCGKVGLGDCAANSNIGI